MSFFSILSIFKILSKNSLNFMSLVMKKKTFHFFRFKQMLKVFLCDMNKESELFSGLISSCSVLY